MAEAGDNISLVEMARERLEQEWQALLAASANTVATPLPPYIAEAISRAVNSTTKTYRYVLPTQLLAKTVDALLDARCVQVGSGLDKPFDARSLCHQIIVPFDRRNSDVLGGSAEPYLNNPLRIGSITSEHRAAQRNRAGFDDLMLVLDYVQAEPGMAADAFRAVLQVIRDRLATTTVVYPVPNRASLKQTLTVVDQFLNERTGGLRLQAVAVALFRSIGKQFKLFESVDSNNINAADAATGSAADLECLDKNGAVVMAVEVKDRELRLNDIQSKLPMVREKGIKELPFLIQGSIQPDDAQAIESLVDREFVTGQNIYLLEFRTFLESCLVLFQEAGRREFLRGIGEELNNVRADVEHRRTWSVLLTNI